MSSLPEYDRAEVATHHTEDDFWTIIRGNVYHLDAQFVRELHPGGAFIMEAAGKDGTILFQDSNHPESSMEVLEEFKIGKLKK